MDFTVTAADCSTSVPASAALIPLGGVPAFIWLLAAALLCHRSNDFREGALLAVNLGDDADTTGAVYGQLAGAYYGEEAIPTKWREVLVKLDLITSYADKLFALHVAG